MKQGIKAFKTSGRHTLISHNRCVFVSHLDFRTCSPHQTLDGWFQWWNDGSWLPVGFTFVSRKQECRWTNRHKGHGRGRICHGLCLPSGPSLEVGWKTDVALQTVRWWLPLLDLAWNVSYQITIGFSSYCKQCVINLEKCIHRLRLLPSHAQ